MLMYVSAMKLVKKIMPASIVYIMFLLRNSPNASTSE